MERRTPLSSISWPKHCHFRGAPSGSYPEKRRARRSSRSTASRRRQSSDWPMTTNHDMLEDMATILLIGPDAPLLEGLAQTLAAVGHRPVLANSIVEGIEHAAV